MAKIDGHEPSTVTWVDLGTSDLEKARAFYGELLGWSFTGGEDPSYAHYTTALLGGRKVAGLYKSMEEFPAPPAWAVYFATPNADEIARKVTEAGGNVIVAPMDVSEHGRMAVFTDPTGAFFGVWQAKEHKGAEVVGETGAMVWHEVYTRDAAKARTFYVRALGLETKRLDEPNVEYWTLHKGPTVVGGLMQMTDQFPKEVPSHWNTYFAVSNTDAAVRKVLALGGAELAPAFDTPYGRMAVVADPGGAPFCVISPTDALGK